MYARLVNAYQHPDIDTAEENRSTDGKPELPETEPVAHFGLAAGQSRLPRSVFENSQI